MTIGNKIGNPEFRAPLWLLPVFAPLALAYRLAVACRDGAYRLGLLRAHAAACPVISVGNLTVGGSGKTPLIGTLLEMAQEAGRHPAVISRGYRSKGGDSIVRVMAGEGWPPNASVLGDEPAQLALRYPGVPVYVGRRRVKAARLAAAWDDPALILLDDGFQHRALARNLNLLLIDAENGLGNGRMLPFGPLREPAGAIARADAVLITKTDLRKAEETRAVWRGKVPGHIPIFLCEFTARTIHALNGDGIWTPESLNGREVSLVCGIADPDGFSRTVSGLGGQVKEVLAFGDHHDYPPGDLERLEAALTRPDSAPNAGSPDSERPPRWLTTEKDAVKLRGRLAQGDRLGVLAMEMLPEPAARAFFFDFISKGGIK